MTAPARPKVVLLGRMYHGDGEAFLAEHVDLETLPTPSADGICKAVRSAAAVWVRYPVHLSREAISKASELIVMSASGRGTDSIDIEAATEHVVAVVNNPGLGAIPVSEHAIGLMLALAKQITRGDALTRHGDGWAYRDPALRISLDGRTLGVIGLGTIGTEVTRKCVAAFHMRVLAYDPYVSAGKAEALGAVRVSALADLLREADVVSIHAELTNETHAMIGEAELRLMRRDAFLVNTARGAIVRPSALVRALSEGWIRGAAIDVFDPEPPSADSPLFTLDNLLVSPHVANLTAEAVRGLAMLSATQILQALRGERPPHLVNPEVWERVQRRAKH